MSMTINEVLQEHQQLQITLTKAVKNYEKRTGSTVTSLKLNKTGAVDADIEMWVGGNNENNRAKDSGRS